jgi:hypothetical protein
MLVLSLSPHAHRVCDHRTLPSAVIVSSEAQLSWQQYKAAHPADSIVCGIVLGVEPFGVFLDLGVPFTALLLVPYITPIQARKHFPEDYPRVGAQLTALIRHFGDEASPNGFGKIGLTQDGL